MATPRSKIVDETVTCWYHCISRCVRRAFLFGAGCEHRKQWIEDRLKELVELFAIDCAGFALMDNHLHVLLRLDSARAQAWSDEEVARRWLRLFPLRDLDGQALAVSEARVQQFTADVASVTKARARLRDLSWFMKCVKEPLARLANKEDGCTGAFWEGRFRSVAVLDERSLLTTAAYIDLNPVAAGVSPTPEQSEHTSFRARLDHCRANGTIESLKDGLSTETVQPAQEADGWLLPLNDRRDCGETRAGLMSGFTLSCYLRLVDWTCRLLRGGKAHVPTEVLPIFERIRVDPAEWGPTLAAMLAQSKATGSHFGNRGPLAAAARMRGRQWHRQSWPCAGPVVSLDT